MYHRKEEACSVMYEYMNEIYKNKLLFFFEYYPKTINLTVKIKHEKVVYICFLCKQEKVCFLNTHKILKVYFLLFSDTGINKN